MALRRSDNIPKDAVILDNDAEAASYIWEIVYEWKSLSQTWALRHGPVILGGINAFCGLMINKHYRTKLKLAQYGYLSSAVPICVMPGILTVLFHRYLVSTNMLLMKNESCAICYEIKAGVIQCGFGLVYPMMLGPTSALMLANRYATYRVPDLKEGPKVIFQFLRTTTRPFTNTLLYMAAIQLAASSIITYFQLKNNYSLRKEMLEIEQKLIAQTENNH